METKTQKLASLIKQPSTIRGMITLAGFLGWVLTDAQAESMIGLVLLGIAIYEVIHDEDSGKVVAILLAILLSAWAIPALAADAVSDCTQEHQQLGNIHVIEMSCTCEATGQMTAEATDWRIDGFLIDVETDPGSTAPTALYDLTLTNSWSRDVTGGYLANRSATVTESIAEAGWMGSPVAGGVTLNVTNQSVNAATFKVRLYYYSD